MPQKTGIEKVYVHDILDIDKIVSPIFVGDMDFYVRNNEWTVMSFPARRNVAYYKCCPEPFRRFGGNHFSTSCLYSFLAC